MPTIYVIAGPNGVGKTTFADRHLPQTIKELEFINVDQEKTFISFITPDGKVVNEYSTSEKNIIVDTRGLNRGRYIVKVRNSRTTNSQTLIIK